MAETIEKFMQENPSSVWANFVVVLNQGLIFPCEEGLLPYGLGNHYFRNNDIRKISNSSITPIPDTGSTLLIFYLYLMELLGNCQVKTPNLYQYVRLPFTSGDKAYYFNNAELEEIGQCPQHGFYYRQVSDKLINMIVDECFKCEDIDLFTLFNTVITQNSSINYKAMYQSNHVYVYNPENLPLADIFTLPQSAELPQSFGLQYYSLTIEGKQYLIPKYYSFRDGLISECPKCNYPANFYTLK